MISSMWLLMIWTMMNSRLWVSAIDVSRAHEIFRRNSPDNRDDELWCQVAKDLRYFAEESRRLYTDSYPDIYDPEISALECLYRLAILASKASATAEEIYLVDEWAKWWDAKYMPIKYDSRSVIDRLLAYTIERKGNHIEGSKDQQRFEEIIASRIRNSDEATVSRRL